MLAQAQVHTYTHAHYELTEETLNITHSWCNYVHTQAPRVWNHIQSRNLSCYFCYQNRAYLTTTVVQGHKYQSSWAEGFCRVLLLGILRMFKSRMPLQPTCALFDSHERKRQEGKVGRRSLTSISLTAASLAFKNWKTLYRTQITLKNQWYYTTLYIKGCTFIHTHYKMHSTMGCEVLHTW